MNFGGGGSRRPLPPPHPGLFRDRTIARDHRPGAKRLKSQHFPAADRNPNERWGCYRAVKHCFTADLPRETCFTGVSATFLPLSTPGLASGLAPARLWRFVGTGPAGIADRCRFGGVAGLFPQLAGVAPLWLPVLRYGVWLACGAGTIGCWPSAVAGRCGCGWALGCSGNVTELAP